MDIERFKVDTVPDTCYYIPNFISDAEEKLLLHNISKTPSTQWTQLSNRRLLNIGGIPMPKGMIATKIDDYLQKYVDKVNELNIFGEGIKANHILLNEYRKGQGICKHYDGPLYTEVISTISVGSHTILEFFNPPNDDNFIENTRPAFKLLVERNSLIILKNDMYTKYMHGISEIEEDDCSDALIKNLHLTAFKPDDKLTRSVRYSLTIRSVPNTSKFKLKFFK